MCSDHAWTAGVTIATAQSLQEGKLVRCRRQRKKLPPLRMRWEEIPLRHTQRDCLFPNLVFSALYILTSLCLRLLSFPSSFQNFGQVDIVSKDPRTVVLMLDSPEPLVQAKACEALLKYMQQCELELDVWLQQTHTNTQESTVSRPSCSHIRVSWCDNL